MSVGAIEGDSGSRYPATTVAPRAPYRVVFALIVACGAALRLWQYFGRASLWLDELGLATSILNRPLRTLLAEPLLFDQVAPPGFLAAVKGATALP